MSSSLRCIVFVFILFNFSSALSAVQIINFSAQTFSRADGPFFGNQNATIHTIYGGLSGTCDTKVPNSVCNSCVTDSPDPTAPCNSRRVHETLRFGISIQSDQRGQVMVTNDLDDAQDPLDFYVNGILNNEQIFEPNTTVLVEVPWGEICGDIVSGLDSACNPSTGSIEAGNIRIGINNIPQGTPGGIGGGTGGGSGDNQLTSGEFVELRIVMGLMPEGQTSLCTEGGGGTPTGACNFIAYPGDKKIFLEEVYADCNFPGIEDSDASVVSIRVYHSDSLPYPNINSPDFSDIQVRLNSPSACNNGVKLVNLVDPIVDGLTNDTPHYFAIGLVDETTNVGFVTDMSAGSDNQDDQTLCYEGTDSDWPQNCHRAVPAEVIGLIEDEFDCFITTATYGSPFRPKVEDFRNFRNRFLKTNWLGQKVIQFYYENSPSIAAWIRNNPRSKPLVRGLLYPFWLFAKVSILWPLTTISFLILSFLSLLALVIRKRNFQ